MQRISLTMKYMILIACLCGSSHTIAADRPNIILIFTDDQGYQDLGCFGSKSIRTPHLDRMAAEGLKLTSFYAQPVCGVSRAALMTGSYPIRVAEPGNIKRLHTVPHPNEVTMAEVLSEAGYRTGIIGKWHLALEGSDHPSGFDPATMPNAQGFDEFYGTPRFNGFTVLVDDTKVRSPLMRNDEVVVREVESWDNITADYTVEAIKWITSNRGRPFFLYLAHNMPHIPLGASENFKGKSAGGFYGDTIEEIDWSCGEIFRTLKELNIDENTLVIFTSDNGPWVETTRGMVPGGKTFIPRDHSGNVEPLRGWKMSAWEGGCRVPFIARWPGRIPGGWESDEILTTMDLLPTFASIAGAVLPETPLDGKDATDFLIQKSNSPRDEYLYYSGCLLTGVRSAQWKLVLPREKKPAGLGWWSRMIDAVPQTQLFDLTADPGEGNNLAKQNPEVVASLLKRIEKARVELGDIDRTGSGARSFDEGPRKLQVPVNKAPPKKKSESPGYQKSVPSPTITGVKYGDHNRHVIDFWQAESETPTPLVFVVHGGGWRGGSKELIHKFVDTKALLDAGISVAAINYRYTTQAGRTTPPVRVPLYDAARALQFVRSQAKNGTSTNSESARRAGRPGHVPVFGSPSMMISRIPPATTPWQENRVVSGALRSSMHRRLSIQRR
ncbi:MAG: sulfatase-like hydrolase/transferase [Planctomycetaceae bacterium]|nr:sulfatase-like hydrolase/transferase [Planctomycetaceae bacterium]